MLKKSIFSILAVSLVSISFCACATSTSSIQHSQDNSQSETSITITQETVNQEIESTTNSNTSNYVLETEQINYHRLSNDEFAKKVSKDFSTEKIKFKTEKYSDDIYYVKSQDTQEIDEIMVSCSDYGNHLTLTCSKDASNGDTYDVLLQGLKSDLFGFSFDEQVEILAQFQVGTVDFQSTHNKIPIQITEKDNDYSRLLFFLFTN